MYRRLPRLPGSTFTAGFLPHPCAAGFALPVTGGFGSWIAYALHCDFTHTGWITAYGLPHCCGCYVPSSAFTLRFAVPVAAGSVTVTLPCPPAADYTALAHARSTAPQLLPAGLPSPPGLLPLPTRPRFVPRSWVYLLPSRILALVLPLCLPDYPYWLVWITRARVSGYPWVCS